MIGRMLHKADFERALSAASRSRSAHFAVHYLYSKPTVPQRRQARPEAGKLSTACAPLAPRVVDEVPSMHWLGSVVPKRHARRAVTRTLLKRQIRSALARHAARLPPGLWLVRLRAPFAPAEYPAAASDALRRAARDELEHLLARAAS